MGDVVTLPGTNGLAANEQVKPEQVLQSAMDGGLQDAIVIGTDAEGTFFLAASDGNTSVVIGKLFSAAHFLAARDFGPGNED